MTESHESRIPWSDLTNIALPCPSCGAETIVNIADDRQHRIWDDGTVVMCGVCQHKFDNNNVKGALVRLREYLLLIKKSGLALTFRVRTDN
jgi:predicted RNA-binding Zn-ribbon protein involved in translation (DUF1610 family)